jgi:biopolymer transport protein ExbB/TolQ
MQCPKCGSENIGNESNVCQSCGASLPGISPAPTGVVKNVCTKCGAELPSTDMANCPVCGMDLQTNKAKYLLPPAVDSLLLGKKAALIGSIAGLIVTVLVIFGLYQIARPATFLQRMFLPGGIYNSVPFSITFLFFWSVSVLVAHVIGLRRQQKFFSSPNAAEVDNLLTEGDVSGALLKAKQLSNTSIFFNRLHRALYHLYVSENEKRVETELQRESDMDIEVAASGYSEIRTFVWAMPILGFIGTVIGIGAAVDQFSNFLGGEIQNIDTVKNQLMSVTHGLSFAFLTTLHGLLGALFVVLPSSTLQKEEEDFYGEVDRRTRQILVPHLKPSTPGKITGVADLNITPLVEAIKALLPSIAGIKDDLNEFSKKLLETYAKGIAEANQKMGDEIRNSHNELINRFDSVNREYIKESLNELRKGCEQISNHVLSNVEACGNKNMAVVEETGDRQAGRLNECVAGIGARLVELGSELSKETPDNNGDG